MIHQKNKLKYRCKDCKEILIIPEEVYETPSCKKCGGTKLELIRIEKEVITK
jgi:rRNA maturation endonuclease Nob1